MNLNLKAIVVPLFNICFGPVPPPLLPEAPPSSSVVVSQIGQNLSVSWDACKAAQAAVELYFVCVERTPGVADVVGCTNVGSAQRAELPYALAGVRSGDKITTRVRCVAVDGSAAEVKGEPVTVDMGGPALTGLSVARVSPVNASLAPPIPFSMAITDTATMRLTFTVAPSIACVSVVRYTITESSDVSNSTAFAFEPRDAGSGTVVSGPGAPSPSATGASTGSTTSTAVAVPSLNFSGGSLGWNDTRSFDFEISNAGLVSGTYYGVVFITTCVVTQWVYRTAAPVLFDATGPAFLDDGKVPTVTMLAVSTKSLYASWPRLVDPESGVVYAVAQFVVAGAPYASPVTIGNALYHYDSHITTHQLSQ